MLNVISQGFEENMFNKLTTMAIKSSNIDPELFGKYKVKRGLRDIDGTGVLVGLSEVGAVSYTHLTLPTNREV